MYILKRNDGYKTFNYNTYYKSGSNQICVEFNNGYVWPMNIREC